MKLQLESYGKKFTIETGNDDLNAQEYLDLFVGLMIQATFRPKTVSNAIIELAEYYKED